MHAQRGFSTILLALVIVVLLVLGGAGYWFLFSQSSQTGDTVTPTPTPTVVPSVRSLPGDEPAFTPQTFQQQKSPHFVSSDPANNAVLTSAPTQVTIAFDFDVATGSRIVVTRDGEDVTTGATTITEDRLHLHVPIQADQTGNYAVTYTACWPDGSCHDGSFGFSINL